MHLHSCWASWRYYDPQYESEAVTVGTGACDTRLRNYAMSAELLYAIRRL